MNRLALLLCTGLVANVALAAETCTTQSAMAPADRTALADAVRSLAAAVQDNQPAALRAASTPEIQKDFGALQYMVAMDAPKLVGAPPQVEQLYLLDASSLKPTADGAPPEAQFFCSLNKSTAEVDFVIPGLPPGRYAFVMVSVAAHTAPWRLSMLLRQDGARWLLAGFYPKPLTLATHDGLWYWKEARQYAEQKQPWNAWLFFQEAQALLRPAEFVLSTHLDKLRTEATSAAPPALSGGISAETPLVLKAPFGGSDLPFTSLALAEPLVGATTPVLAVHLRADALPDPAAARQRNADAARALLAAYPELRRPFQSIAITTDSPGQPSLTTQLPIADVK